MWTVMPYVGACRWAMFASPECTDDRWTNERKLPANEPVAVIGYGDSYIVVIAMGEVLYVPHGDPEGHEATFEPL